MALYQTKLEILDVGANEIIKIPSNIARLVNLEDLWLNDNKIERFDDVENWEPLKLTTLYLERNPVSK